VAPAWESADSDETAACWTAGAAAGEQAESRRPAGIRIAGMADNSPSSENRLHPAGLQRFGMGILGI
jgi:hypothetical protein